MDGHLLIIIKTTLQVVSAILLSPLLMDHSEWWVATDSYIENYADVLLSCSPFAFLNDFF